MNTNTITKFFTLVSFFVVTVFGNPGFASPTTTAQPTINVGPTQTQAQIDADKEARATKTCESDTALVKQYGGSKAKCVRCEAYGGKGCDDSKDDSSCEEAFKSYTDSLADTQSACESVVGKSPTTDTKKKCSETIAECANAAKQSTNLTSQTDNGMTSTINIFRQMVSGEESLGTAGTNSCLVDIDSKEARDAEKEFRDRKKDLEKEKKDIEDEAIKDKEENDKEITRITKEIQELQRDNRKLLADVDVRMREKDFDTQKERTASGERLQNLTKKISETNDKMRQITFQYSDSMLDYSADKQNLRCKSALDQAKTCLIKSVKNIADANCKDFPMRISSKGPKATAELKAQLTVVNDACYEKEAREKKKVQFAQQEQLNKINSEMTSLQQQIQQEAKTQQDQADNSQKIQQEAQREKSEAEANLAQQIATLQGEMAQLAQKLEAKNYRSQERLQKLVKDLQELEVEQKTGKRSKTSLASAAVHKTKLAVEEVISQCDCVQNITAAKSGQEGNANASEVGRKKCAALKRTLPSGGGGSSSGTRSSGSSGSAF